MQLEKEAPPETNDLLQRILKAVEPARPKPRRKFEALAALVLSIATIASAWCAYQSKLWGGAQAARAGAGAAAAREIAEEFSSELADPPCTRIDLRHQVIDPGRFDSLHRIGLQEEHFGLRFGSIKLHPRQQFRIEECPS